MTLSRDAHTTSGAVEVVVLLLLLLLLCVCVCERERERERDRESRLDSERTRILTVAAPVVGADINAVMSVPSALGFPHGHMRL
jgi:hypothetical protein